MCSVIKATTMGVLQTDIIILSRARIYVRQVHTHEQFQNVTYLLSCTFAVKLNFFQCEKCLQMF